MVESIVEAAAGAAHSNTAKKNQVFQKAAKMAVTRIFIILINKYIGNFTDHLKDSQFIRQLI